MRFTALDSLRGVCACCVVAFHLPITSGLFSNRFFENSYLFVDFFFVLSGFVISHAYWIKIQERKNLQSFIIKRLRRIYPLHIFFLFIFIFFEFCKNWVEGLGMNFTQSSFTGSNHPNEIVPNLFLLQSWFFNFDEKSFNAPSWSISSELYLYILFGFLLAYISKFRLLGLIALTALFYTLYISSNLIPETASRAGFGFLSGALIWIFHNRYMQSVNISTIWELIILSIVFLVVVKHNGTGILDSTLAFSCAILIFSCSSGLVNGILISPIPSTLGRWSYSIYMSHSAVIFVLIALSLIFEELFNVPISVFENGSRYLNFGWLGNSLFSILTYVSTFAVSIFTYKNIEMRFK